MDMELLSPAGSPACALAAFDAGADAVYAGCDPRTYHGFSYPLSYGRQL